METKICKDCNIEKTLDEFPKTYNKKRNRTYTHNFCIKCYKKRKRKWDKTYRLNHNNEIKKRRRLKSEEHKKYCEKWHINHKQYEKEYREKNKEYIKERNKKWCENNIDKVREYHKNYKREARKDNLIYFKDRIRNMISHSFRRKGYTKKSNTYKILGADYYIVWKHLKETWYRNYGREYNNEPYEIDHIKPLTTAKTEEEVIKLCHYTNLQLLTPEDNLKKSDKW